MTSLPLQTLTPDLLKLAVEAGQAIMAIYNQGEVEVSQKEDQSPLTLADLASNQVIVTGLKDLSPQLPILSEESKTVPYEDRQSWSQFWLVDPLDGTKEFIKRNGEFTVNIALVENGSPVLGVVHAPAINTTYWGISGVGAFKQTPADSTPQPLTTRFYPEPLLKIVASRSHAGAETEAFLEKLKAAQGDLEVVSIGSSLKLCLVADGSAHLYPRFGPTMEWDTAAAHCVVEQAGGQVTNMQGEPLHYNKSDLLNPFFMVAGQAVAEIWPNWV